MSISLCTCSTANEVRRSCSIVVLKYVLRRRRTENDLSVIAVLAGMVIQNRFTLQHSYVLKPKSKGGKPVGQHWQPLNHRIWRTPLTSQMSISLCTCRTAKEVRRSCSIVVLKYVLRRRRTENDLSVVALLRTLNSNNANYYVFWFLQQEFITFIILNYFVLPNFYYKYTQ
jgi:hypothetical protein